MLAAWLRSRGVPVRPLRVPTRLQFQTTECGVAALAMVLAHFGRPVPLEELRARTGVSRDCVNAAEIARAARHYGLTCRAHSLEPDALPGLPLPLLVHLHFVHFVVVEGFTARDVLVNDPACGPSRIPRERFFEAFTGVVLSFGGSVPAATPQRPEGAWRAWLRRSGPGLRRGQAATLAAGVGAAALAVAAVRGLGQAVDAGGGAAAAASGAAALAALGLLGAQAAGAARLQGALADRHRLLLARHLTRLPPAFFLYRLPSRLAGLLCSPETAAIHTVQRLTGLARLAMLPLATIALLALHPLAGAALGGILGVGAALLVAGLRLWGDANLHHRRHAPEGGEPPHQTLAELEQFHLAGRARELAGRWLGQQAQRHGHEARSARLEAALDGIAAGSAALGFAATLGVLLAGGAPAGTLVAAALLALMAGAALGELAPLLLLRHRLDRVLQPMADVLGAAPGAAPAAGASADPAPPPLPAGLALRAHGLRFGYSATRAPLIDGIDLELRAGEQLGLTGPSGGGKSTVAAVLAGRLPPWDGAVQHATADGRARAVGWVDRSAFLFEGSVRQNLCLWRAVAPDRLAAAVADAELADVLAARPGGLDAPVEVGGRNFSGGQRQRLEIARALVSDPAVLVLDEALDGLDPALERRIRDNLRRRGCALVVVSHRAFTLAQCDRVLRVAGGRLGPGCADDAPGSGQPAPPACAPADPGPAADGAGAQEALARALAAVARHGGVPAPNAVSPPGAGARAPGLRPDDGVTGCAAAAGLLAQPVRLVEASAWGQLGAPVLAFARADGRPVVVLPGGRQLDPASGRARPLRDPAGTLRTDAWAVLPARPAGSGSRALLRSLLPDLRTELGRGTAAAALAAGLALLPALWVLRLAAPPAPPAGLALVLAAGCMALACALGEHVATAAAARLSLALQRHGMARLAWHAARLDLLAVRDWDRFDLARRLEALPRMLRRLGGRPLRAGRDALTLVATLALLAALSPAAGLSSALIAAVALAVPLAIGRATARREPAHEHADAATARLVHDLLGGTERLRLLGRYRQAMRHWLARRRQWSREGGATRWRNAVLSLLPDAAGALAVATVVPLTATADPLPATLPAVAVLAWAVTRSALGAGLGLAALAGLQPIRDDADRLLAVPPEPAGVPLPPDWRLRLHGIGFAYPGSPRPALDGLTLDLRAGEHLAITGPSGSGKSTLLRVLLGLQPPDAGRIERDGMPLQAADWAGLRDATARVTQDARLELTQTLRGQIADGAGASLAAVRQAIADVGMQADIDALPMGLQTIAEHGRLSSGQEQRLLIARELVRRPRLLILDEATNAIEETAQAALLARLRARGIACVLVTHRESALRAMDRIVVLREGRIVWEGTPAQLDAAAETRAMLQAERQEGHR